MAFVEPAAIDALRLLPARRSIVATTSADVNGVPSCHFTPWRRLNVHTLPSAFGAHFSASIGRTSPASASTRYSKHVVTGQYVPRSAMATGSRGPAGVWATIRKVPPCLMLAAAAVPPGAVVPPAAVVPADAVVPPVVAFEPLLESLPHAEMIAAITGRLRPIIEPRRRKSRRAIRPCAYASIVSSSIGVTFLRTRSNTR